MAYTRSMRVRFVPAIARLFVFHHTQAKGRTDSPRHQGRAVPCDRSLLHLWGPATDLGACPRKAATLGRELTLGHRRANRHPLFSRDIGLLSQPIAQREDEGSQPKHYPHENGGIEYVLHGIQILDSNSAIR